MSQLVELSTQGPIATLMLNRPDQRNALSLDLLSALHQQLDVLQDQLARHDPPRVLILGGRGRAFCAGMDLKQVLDLPGAPLKLLTSLAEACVKLRLLPVVTIAHVSGAAIGGGCGLTTVCDFAVTHADSKMGFPEVDLGVCPAVVAPWLVRKIGSGPARAMLLRGGLLSGQEALALGLVSQCVESREALEPAVQALAERLATGGTLALRATKQLLNHLDNSGDLALARRCAAISAEVLATEESRATLRAKIG